MIWYHFTAAKQYHITSRVSFLATALSHWFPHIIWNKSPSTGKRNYKHTSFFVGGGGSIKVSTSLTSYDVKLWLLVSLFHLHHSKRIPLFPPLMVLLLSFLHLMIVLHKSVKSWINILNMQTMPSEGQRFGFRLKNSNISFIVNYYIGNILLLSSLSSPRSFEP